MGPVIKSKTAAAFGLGVSMLERLMANPLYSRHDWGYNPRLVRETVTYPRLFHVLHRCVDTAAVYNPAAFYCFR